MRDEVRALACGLAAKGLQRGDKVAIIGDNRPQLYWAMVATQCFGGVPVPLYQDAVADEMQFVLEHAETRFAIAEDQEQVDKLLLVKERCPQLEIIVYEDPRGCATTPSSSCSASRPSRRRGASSTPANRRSSRNRSPWARATTWRSFSTLPAPRGGPRASCCRTTTSSLPPAMPWNAKAWGHTEEILSYLPMAWVGDHIFSYGQFYCGGFTLNCPESSDTVLTDLHDIGPTYFFAPAAHVGEHSDVGHDPPGRRRLDQAQVCHFFCVWRSASAPASSPMRPSIRLTPSCTASATCWFSGRSRTTWASAAFRLAYTAGEAIGSEIFNFYRSLGINIKQLYGMTEASVFVCVQPDGEVKPDTVGTVMPEVELKIAADGEVLYRSPGVFQGYYKNPDATAEAMEDGWVHSGDAGYLDDEGHLKIIDRPATSATWLTGRTRYSRRATWKQAEVQPLHQGGRRFRAGTAYVGAFINIDLEAVGPWAERRGLVYTSYADLAARSEVYDLVQGEIERVNASLAEEPQMAGAQMQRFLVLHKELDPDDGELTRTRKVRRRVIADKYGELIEALYSDNEYVSIEAQVVFEDGRTGTIKADLRLRAVTPQAVEALATAGWRAMDMSNQESLLSVEGVSLSFGAVQALIDVSIEVYSGEILAIIGPKRRRQDLAAERHQRRLSSPAGPAGFHGPDSPPQSAAVPRGPPGYRPYFPERGAVQGHEHPRQPHDRARSAHAQRTAEPGACTGAARCARKKCTASTSSGVIDFLEIEAIRKTPVGRLPYGLQKRVELGRALAAEPRLLLLDEPMAGMNVEEKEDMCRFILDIRDEFDITCVLIEHDMGVVMDISDRVVVLDYGRKIADGSPDEVRGNADVIAAYLGVAHA